MNRYAISDWINSAGGPFVVMEEGKASLWKGVNGSSSDYDLACQTSDYVEKLYLHDTEILVLGDEPLQTAIAFSDDRQLIVRWKWADSEPDVQNAIEKIDFDTVHFIEKITVDWKSQPLVIFNAADEFDPAQCLEFSTRENKAKISTFIHQPTSTTSLLVHSIDSIP